MELAGCRLLGRPRKTKRQCVRENLSVLDTEKTEAMDTRRQCVEMDLGELGTDEAEAVDRDSWKHVTDF